MKSGSFQLMTDSVGNIHVFEGVSMVALVSTSDDPEDPICGFWCVVIFTADGGVTSIGVFEDKPMAVNACLWALNKRRTHATWQYWQDYIAQAIPVNLLDYLRKFPRF